MQLNQPTYSRHTGRALALLGLLSLTGLAPRIQAAINSPLQIPDHALWLDADDFDGDGVPDTGESGTPASVWVDKSSGLGTTSVEVTAGAPTLEFGVTGSRNAVRFSGGSEDKMDNTDFLLQDYYTVFTIIHSNDVQVSGHVLSGINEFGTDTVLYRTGDGGHHIYSGQSSGNSDYTIRVKAGDIGFTLLGYQVNADGGDLGFFQNQDAQFELNGPATLNGIRIGNLDRADPSNVTQAEAFHGDISEVIIYARVLTPAEIADVRGYLKAKYTLNFPDPVIPTGKMTDLETGMVTGGTPSTLDPNSEPVLSGRTNLALAEHGGVAFSQDHIGVGSPRDFRAYRVNNGFYSDPPEGAPPIEEPWIGGLTDSYLGVKFPAPVTIDRIGFENEFPGRRNATVYFEYSRDSFDDVLADEEQGLEPAGTAAKTWQLLDIKIINDDANTRHLYSFDALTGVTAVRMRIESSSIEFAVAEMEVWNSVGGVAPLPAINVTGVSADNTSVSVFFTRPVSSPGFAYTLEQSETTASGWIPVPAAVFETISQSGDILTVKASYPRPAARRVFQRVRVSTASP